MNEVVAKRYADALFQLASEKNNVDELISELKVVKEVFQDNKEMTNFLNHPRISHAEKMNTIDKAFDSFHKAVVNTLKILIDRHRIHIIPAIVDAFVEQYNEENKIAEATVYSVRALSDEEQEKVADSLKAKLGKNSVSINNIVDPSVIGGIRIRIGNTIYDGSISGQLNRIKHNIASSTI